MHILLVALFGAGGVLIRYMLMNYLPSESISWSVLVVNVVGSFLTGVFLSQKIFPELHQGPLQAALVVGFLGGLTTFSSYSADALRLIQDAKWLLFFVAVLLNNTISIAACFLGYKIAS